MNEQEAIEIINSQEAEIARLESELARIRKANIAFLKKVAYMQDLQAKYFSTRDHEVLVQSKAIEKEVREYIKRCFDRLAELDPEFSEKVNVIKDTFDAEKQ